MKFARFSIFAALVAAAALTGCRKYADEVPAPEVCAANTIELKAGGNTFASSQMEYGSPGNRLLSYQPGGNTKYTYGYNAAGQLESIREVDNNNAVLATWHYVYNSGRLSSIMKHQGDMSAPMEAEYKYAYATNGELRTVVIEQMGGRRDSLVLTNYMAGKPGFIRRINNLGTNATVDQIQLDYDNNGNMLRRIEAVNSSNFDTLYRARFFNANILAPTVPPIINFNAAWDPFGNYNTDRNLPAEVMEYDRVDCQGNPRLIGVELISRSVTDSASIRRDSRGLPTNFTTVNGPDCSASSAQPVDVVVNYRCTRN